jgi:hypothetical protein
MAGRLLAPGLAALAVAALGCGATSVGPAPSTPHDTTASAKRAFHRLSARPDWLFPFDACPADAFPGIEKLVPFAGGRWELDVDASLDRCQANDANACYAAALQAQQAKVPSDYAEALFSRACSLGLVTGCTNRAAGLVTYASPEVDPWPCANRTFEAMCSRDDPWACTMWGASLLRGRGVQKDVPAALKVLPKGCLLGEDDPACEAARKLLREADTTSI